MLAKFVRENPLYWDSLLPMMMLSLNSACHTSTKLTPARLMLSRELRLPIDLVNDPPQCPTLNIDTFAQENSAEASISAQRKWNYRCTHGAYKVGDSVFVAKKNWGKGPK